jgi:membrane protein required for colicin V production
VNILDGLILVILAWNLLRGISKGFVEELFSIAGFVISAAAAFKLAPIVAKYLLKYPTQSALVITGLFIYFIFYAIFRYIAVTVEKRISESSAGFINSLLGFIFGLLRGLLMASVAVFVVAAVSPNGYLIRESTLGGLTVPFIDATLKVVGDRIDERWKENWQIARENLVRNFLALNGKREETQPSPVQV